MSTLLTPPPFGFWVGLLDALDVPYDDVLVYITRHRYHLLPWETAPADKHSENQSIYICASSPVFIRYVPNARNHFIQEIENIM